MRSKVEGNERRFKGDQRQADTLYASWGAVHQSTASPLPAIDPANLQ